VLSWEYFNEISSKGNSMTDPFWKATTAYLSSIDINHHLITNSYQGIDTRDKHAYISRTDTFAGLTKFLPGAVPHTTAEFGQDAFYNLPPGYDPDGIKAHEGLWASLMGQRSGAWYWWLDEQIVPDNLYATVFRGISAFTADEDLGSLQWKRAKFTPVSGPGGMVYYGMVGSDHHALIWIERTTSASFTDNPPANGNVVALGGLAPDHPYTIQWWNTTTGTVTQTASASTDAGGKIQLAVPDGVTRDIAAKVLP
jgi:hypothetical protein